MTMDEPGTGPGKPRIVRCPACRGDSIYAPSNPFRPFCSERCKNMDLGAWASESFRVAENDTASPDDPEATRLDDK
jgi:endogenous inhibitor of DNA gyrase (YacG/DUF329 family)